MTEFVNENAGSYEPTAADWASLGEGFAEFNSEIALRDIGASFDAIAAGTRQLNDHDRHLIEMLQGIMKKVDLALVSDSLAEAFTQEQELTSSNATSQIESRARRYRTVMINASQNDAVAGNRIASGVDLDMVKRWASLDAEAFLKITDAPELVAAAYAISENFLDAAGRYGRALYDVAPEVFDTVTLMRGNLEHEKAIAAMPAHWLT